mmetsp:Transcript_20992/g.30831  ORF Transcript_20992/g.30831 Transcript_20992/m.30831 type:complete len:82 (+) Transcript_20992:78-323(+)|eukprot:CAMPEP_0195508654 /NCGR_PEP_ID=MMETSP0794_2-20130614/1809_1 /TAXON_ID=515487 /ORGANISM="Stephanopyxis turris, Strain CCMP 815" /LENGTH=81 /DNA_ID=CAMNT_0040635671 /DNA_START=73 /DNA_END=318 /DNA_ORIENTATION=-
MSNKKQLNYHSDEAVSYIIQRGLEKGVVNIAVGLTLGGMASIVLARGGSGARKMITGFGGGVGLGTAWTRCSLELEDLLKR